MVQTDTIALRGVRVHNLKGIDVDIPLHRITAVTGVSGAGKSSLVFDTLYAEAQRRYLQSFSAYTRQFLERFEQPDAESIGDLPPAVAIRQSAIPQSGRAMVGSVTELAELVRLLFARAGTLFCPECGQPVVAHDVNSAIAALSALPDGSRVTIAFPLSIPEGEDLASTLTALREEGYVRIQIGTTAYRLDDPVAPAIPAEQPAWVLLDRVEVGKAPVERLTESIELAFRRGDGRMALLTDAGVAVFDQRNTCAGCGRIYPALEPRLFDPDDTLGACPECQGIAAGKKGEPCLTCHGQRLNPVALAVSLGNHSIADWFTQPALMVNKLAADMAPLTDQQTTAVLDSIRARLNTLTTLDLGYLSLNEPTAQMPGGVACRLALANALASSLVNVLYLIDEPTADMHPRDIDKIADALRMLRDRGNTIVVIEHERRIIEAADHVIDLGPGAGEEGGQLIYRGPPSALDAAPESPTSDFWTGRDLIEIPDQRRTPRGSLRIADHEIPLGVLSAITGVAGARKERYVIDTLYPALASAKKKKGVTTATSVKVSGANQIADVFLIDQAPIARSTRSNPATYLKIFDAIRELYAETVDARIRNYGSGHFSFNQPGGRCETCEGQGSLTIDMQFLADVTTTCPDCHGRRYRKDILDIKVRGRSIAEVLDLTIREAFRFFRAQPAIEKKLKVLLDVGLEYLRLGQAIETLSGCECQRLKLASHVGSSKKAGSLFFLLEPSASLHPADVANLLATFDRLLSAGHTIVVTETDADILRCADHVIDLSAL